MEYIEAYECKDSRKFNGRMNLHTKDHYTDSYTAQKIYFHGARNTRYTFKSIIADNSIHTSFGTPDDIDYYYGLTTYIPITDDTVERPGWWSEYLQKKSWNLMDFNGLSDTFTTDNNGNYVFQFTLCICNPHSGGIKLRVWLEGYENNSKPIETWLDNIDPLNPEVNVFLPICWVYQ